MPRLFCLIPLAALLMAGEKGLDGGTAEPSSRPSRLDAGILAAPDGGAGSDAGTALRDAGVPAADAGCVVLPSKVKGSICWPREVQPLATLDASAIVAANAALQKVLALFPKERADTCEYSARSLEVIIGQEGGMYFVRINRRVDKCGWAAPGFTLETDWFELYAVSPDGRVVERYPYYP